MAKVPPRTTSEILRSLARVSAPAVQDGNSRTANKINVRLPDGMRDQILERCKKEHIAINSYVVQALEEKLARDNGPAEILVLIQEQLAAITTHLGISADTTHQSPASTTEDARAAAQRRESST